MKRDKRSKKAKVDTPSKKGNSRYARKRAYLFRTNQCGWEVPAPKPWK